MIGYHALHRIHLFVSVEGNPKLRETPSLSLKPGRTWDVAGGEQVLQHVVYHVSARGGLDDGLERLDRVRVRVRVRSGLA